MRGIYFNTIRQDPKTPSRVKFVNGKGKWAMAQLEALRIIEEFYVLLLSAFSRSLIFLLISQKLFGQR